MGYESRAARRGSLGTWNGRPLFADPSGEPVAGGTLLALGAPAKQDDYVRVDDVGFEVVAQTRNVIVRMSDALPFDSLVTEAIKYAARALDLFAASSGPMVTLDLNPESSLSWRVDDGKRVARITIPHGLAIRLSAVVQVTDADGNAVQKPPSPQPVHHESLRYYRLSQCTDDLFDAFRNSYLALESTLSNIEACHREREGPWLKRALGEAQKVTDLSKLLGCEPGEVPDCFYENVYKAVRCPLFHSKGMGLDPASPADRELVMSAYRSTIECFIALASSLHHLKSRGGCKLTPEGFAGLSSALLDGWELRAGIGKNAEEFGPLSILTTYALPHVPNHMQLIGRVSAPFQGSLRLVDFVGAFKDDQVGFWHSYQEPLGTDGLDAFEVILDYWNRTESGYRTQFSG